MTDRHLLVDAPSLPVYDLGPHHPFCRDRQLPLFDLLRTCGLVEDDELLRPGPAGQHHLHAAHDPDYIAAVRALSVEYPELETLHDAFRFGMGTPDNPIAPKQHDSAAATAGATLACVEEVLGGRALRAFNPAGGLHHAMPAQASGFCIYNDLVVAIRCARNLGVDRVLYVDFDVHHGDGVEFAFRDDSSVVTVSFHEDPKVRWPFTGHVEDRGTGAGTGYAVNMPLASHTADESWFACVERVLSPVVRAFQPELIVSQHGCDPHREDPLAELDVTTRVFHESAQLTRALADEVCEGRWVATGGGGYQPYRVIPRAWSMVWAVMSGRTFPEDLDEQWRARWQEKSGEPMPVKFFDEPIPDPRHEAAAAVNEQSLEQLMDGIPWLRD